MSAYRNREARMTLSAGTRLGPYEIVAPLGAGGMGEVYRARDLRLGRDIAIKVLPSAFSADPERLIRFEHEARAAAALNHPNILSVYDIGQYDGAPYIVSELLDGETLRERLTGGDAMPVHKAVECAVQIAHGLAAAHDKRIVHRDLKPENIFITSDGRVKILDFGLAKLTQTEPSMAGELTTTGAGIVLGTVGYMAPEQVRAQPLDQRADIFAFGALLYEMLSGERAFRGGSDVETMNAILSEEPPDQLTKNATITPLLARIVRRCLEKRPDDRFRSAHDLGFALDALSGFSDASAPAETPHLSTVRFRWIAAGAIVSLLITSIVDRSSAPDARQTGPSTPPTFLQLTYRRGTIRSARFSSDGKTILYSAAWDGDPLRIFQTRPGLPESGRLPLPDAYLLSISGSDQLLVSLGGRFDRFLSNGTLARAPLVGGTSRELLENVRIAEWAPNGTDYVVVRRVDEHDRLEFPGGKVLAETTGYFDHPRVSPKGDRIAFLDHPIYGDNRGSVAVVDLKGQKRVLTDEWAGAEGVAWSADGEEIWFAANRGDPNTLYAVNDSRRVRTVLRVPGDLVLHDVSRDGRVLLTRENALSEVFGRVEGETQERNLSALSYSLATDVSNDGKIVLLNELRTGGKDYAVYIRRTDGSPPVRIGDGAPTSLSPDGRWAISRMYTSPPQLLLLPTGAGEMRRLTSDRIVFQWATWFPDGKRLLVAGNEPGHLMRYYSFGLAGGEAKPITREGIPQDSAIPALVSPHGTLIAARGPDGNVALYPVDGGPPTRARGLEQGDQPIRFSEDEKSIYVFRLEKFVRLYRVDLSTGRRELWKEIAPADLTGILSNPSPLITPDGRTYVYSVSRLLSDLYLVQGLK
jgi:serine/threonine protein kinase/Tol biopolymer transport system component